jgi:Arc/MetJ family transcription regulator
VDANRRPAYDIRELAKQISKRDKTSLVIDRAKVAEAREILGTTTLAETVDAALEEVIALAARRRLMERIRRDGGIGPSPEELRRLRRPRGGPLPR